MITPLAVLAVWLLGIQSHKDLYSIVVESHPERYGQISEGVLWTIAVLWPIVELVHILHSLFIGD